MLFRSLRCEGESEAKKLAVELRGIESVEALIKASPRIKKRFDKIGDLLLKAGKFPDSGPSEFTSVSEELFAELARIYEMPGGREAMEKAEADALRRLQQQ